MAVGFGSTVGMSSSTDEIDTPFIMTQQARTTFAYWVWRNGDGGIPGGHHLIINGCCELLYIGPAIGANNFALQFNFDTTSGQWSTADPGKTAWHHYCVTYDNTSTSNNPIVYIDGVSVSVTTVTTPSGTATGQGQLIIGSNGPSGDVFDGAICEMGIWFGRILTLETARQLANGMSPAFWPQGLVFYNPMLRGPYDSPLQKGTPTITGTKRFNHPRIQYPAWMGRKAA